MEDYKRRDKIFRSRVERVGKFKRGLARFQNVKRF